MQFLLPGEFNTLTKSAAIVYDVKQFSFRGFNAHLKAT